MFVVVVVAKQVLLKCIFPNGKSAKTTITTAPATETATVSTSVENSDSKLITNANGSYVSRFINLFCFFF